MLKYEDLMDGLENHQPYGDPTYDGGTEAKDSSSASFPWGSVIGLAGTLLIAPVINTVIDVMDPNISQLGNSRNMISNNVIDLTCITSDDLSSSITKDYCKSLEVIYAMMIRSLISSQTRSRLKNNSGSIFRDIPIQNAYDGLILDKEGNFSQFTSQWLKGKFRAPYSGKAAISVFNESKIDELEKEYRNLLRVEAGIESDPFLKETRGAGPKFIDIELSTTDLSGKAATKNLSIGVAVRPKMVSAADVFSFMVKRNASALEPDKTAKVGFLKSITKLFSREKVVKDAIDNGTASGKAASGLYSTMQKIKNIKKPFVCILISSEIADELKAKYKIDIMNPGVIRSLYKAYPIMSIGIYNSDRDKYFISVTPDAPMNEYTASELSSEISGYEKQLADIVRSKAYTNY